MSLTQEEIQEIKDEIYRIAFLPDSDLISRGQSFLGLKKKVNNEVEWGYIVEGEGVQKIVDESFRAIKVLEKIINDKEAYDKLPRHSNGKLKNTTIKEMVNQAVNHRDRRNEIVDFYLQKLKSSEWTDATKDMVKIQVENKFDNAEKLEVQRLKSLLKNAGETAERLNTQICDIERKLLNWPKNTTIPDTIKDGQKIEALTMKLQKIDLDLDSWPSGE